MRTLITQRAERGFPPGAEMKIEKRSDILFIVSPHIEMLDSLTQRGFAELACSFSATACFAFIH